MSLSSYITRRLADAGIQVNGARPWDVRIHDRRWFRRVAVGGSLALGDSYMDGWWDADDLRGFFHRLLKWRLSTAPALLPELPRFMLDLKRHLLNLQSRRRASNVVNTHYNLPPTLFQHMLGSTMAYSCAYWRHAATLDDAQHNKLDLVCRKLNIGAGDRVLDLGCGFGSFARHAAVTYDCTVDAVNLSGSQLGFAREFCRGLPVRLHRVDYRDVHAYSGKRPFDNIVSRAMFEAIGAKNYRRFMQVVHALLKDGGSWLLHTIGDPYASADPWMNRHIFPNGELPSLEQIRRAARGLFRLHDFHSFGTDYATTLQEWEKNFRSAWEQIRGLDPERFGSRFFRKWVYYLACCAGSFSSDNIQLWHLVMTKGKAPAYEAMR